MHVLLVGGAGYIGSHVLELLNRSGYQVSVIDNLYSGLRSNVPDDIPMEQADIRKPDELGAALDAIASRGPIDAVVHLAALKAAGESMIEPARYAHSNVTGTLNLLEALIYRNIRHVVFSSSAAVYGAPQYDPIDESHPTNPENYYGFTKLEIERNFAWFDKLSSMRFGVLRYFNAAGYDPEGRVRGLESNPANLIPVIMEVAAGTRKKLLVFGDDYETVDGTGVRDYVHVSDLAEAHRLALEYTREEDKSITVNLGSEQGVSVMQVVEAARRTSGRDIAVEIAPRRAGDPPELVASSALARKVLGWEPKYSDIDSIVDTTWKVYRDQ